MGDVRYILGPAREKRCDLSCKACDAVNSYVPAAYQFTNGVPTV